MPSTVKSPFMALVEFLRRNLVSISFPLLTVTAIWLDWSHTRKWKEQQKLKN